RTSASIRPAVQEAARRSTPGASEPHSRPPPESGGTRGSYTPPRAAQRGGCRGIPATEHLAPVAARAPGPEPTDPARALPSPPRVVPPRAAASAPSFRVGRFVGLSAPQELLELLGGQRLGNLEALLRRQRPGDLQALLGGHLLDGSPFRFLFQFPHPLFQIKR